MKTKTKIFTISLLSITSIIAVTALTTSPSISVLGSNVCSSHSGYHYNKVAPTSTSSGHEEFWACCKCHNQFLERPTGDFVTRTDAEMSGGLNSSHIAYLAPVEDLNGVISIKRFKELCNSVTSLNSSNIGVNQDKTYTIKGRVLQRFYTVKKTAKYGLDISSPYKVLLADDTDTIMVASEDLYSTVDNYEGKETTNYEVTGYPSIYLNNKEMYVPDRAYKRDENMTLNINYENYVSSTLSSVNDVIDNIKNINYNVSGHGYGNMYKLEGLKCYLKRDNTYFFTDGNSLLKVIKGATANFSIGSTYDLIGYITTNSWQPSFVALNAKISTSVIETHFEDASKETTIASFKTLQSSQDESVYRYDNFINDYKTIYKATCYVNVYTVNGKYNMTLTDKLRVNPSKDGEIDYLVSRDAASNTWGMIDIGNDNYDNEDALTITKYCPLYPYIGEDNKVEVYFVRYIQEYVNKKPAWTVIILPELLNLEA